MSEPDVFELYKGPTVDGGVVGDCDDLPDTMKVDYVRVYLKEGTKAVTLLDFDGVRYKPTSRILTCSWPTWGDGASVYVPYYPGATYTWQYDPSYVEVLDPSGPQGNKYHFWVAPIENIPQGIYMAHLTVAFPSGYQEMLDLEVEVQPHTPVPPAEILVLKNPPSVAYPVGVWKQPGTLGYEWSTDGGLTWTSIPNDQFYGDYNIFEVYEPIGVPQEIGLCVRARNKCGVSGVLCETVIISAIGGGGAFLSMAPKPDTVWVGQTDATELYELRTPLFDATTAFHLEL